MANGLYDNHQSSLSDLTAPTVQSAPAVAAIAMIPMVVAGLIPLTAGFLFLKDRWTGKKKKK